MALKVKAVENHNDQLHGQRPTTLNEERHPAGCLSSIHMMVSTINLNSA